MEDDEVVIDGTKVDIVTEFLPRLEELFKVRVGCPGPEAVDGGRWESEGRGVKERGASPSPGTGCSLRLFPIPVPGQADRDTAEDLTRAKAYILSLAVDKPACVDDLDSYSPDVSQRIWDDWRDDLELTTQAVVILDKVTSMVRIYGNKGNVARARIYLLQKMKTGMDRSGRSQPSPLAIQIKPVGKRADFGEDEEDRQCCVPPSDTLSPGLESNHDSCYDTDAEASPISSRSNSTHHLDTEGHSDVSRQASDTLAGERSETDEAKVKVGHQQQPGEVLQNIHHLVRATSEGFVPPKDDDSYGSDREDRSRQGLRRPSRCALSGGEGSSGAPAATVAAAGLLVPHTGVASKVEFAIKLGYSEGQIHETLSRLGPNVTNNELLSELIQLGSSDKLHLDSDDDDEDYEGYEDIPNKVEVKGDLDLVLEVGGPAAAQRELIEECSIDSSLSLQTERYSLPASSAGDTTNLRPVVIDGSNVAMSHGNKEVFSCRGIGLAVDWFQQRGHMEITVFVPQWRKEASRPDAIITDQDVLFALERQKVLVFTPARWVAGKRVVCYDDRYIIKLAVTNGGVVVSNDNYRDLLDVSPDYKRVIEERLLMYSFVNDRFMPPDDPLGRHGPDLDNFLCKEPAIPHPLAPACPYGKKCTYGNKCKYYHPERGTVPHKPVTEKLAEQARIRMKEVKERGALLPYDQKQKVAPSTSSPGGGLAKKSELGKTKSLNPSMQKSALTRTKSLVHGLQSPATPRPFAPLPSSLISSSPQEEEEPAEGPSCPAAACCNCVESGTRSDYQQYNERLSQLSRRVVAAEAEEKLKAQARCSSSSSATSSLKEPHEERRHSSSTDVHRPEREGQMLKPPQDLWSYGHSSLRPVRSDPLSNHYDGTSTGGHLALAQKLSGERKKSRDEARLPKLFPVESPPPWLKGGGSGSMSSLEYETRKMDIECGQNVSGSQSSAEEKAHSKLQKSLALTGSEDQRVQKHLARNLEVPHATLRQAHSAGWEQASSPKPAEWFTSAAERQEVYVETGRRDAMGAGRHVALNRQATAPNLKSESARVKVEHAPACKMASAPVLRPSDGQSSAEKTFSGVMRQTSTSDPQLNTQRQELVYGSRDARNADRANAEAAFAVAADSGFTIPPPPLSGDVTVGRSNPHVKYSFGKSQSVPFMQSGAPVGPVRFGSALVTYHPNVNVPPPNAPYLNPYAVLKIPPARPDSPQSQRTRSPSPLAFSSASRGGSPQPLQSASGYRLRTGAGSPQRFEQASPSPSQPLHRVPRVTHTPPLVCPTPSPPPPQQQCQPQAHQVQSGAHQSSQFSYPHKAAACQFTPPQCSPYQQQSSHSNLPHQYNPTEVSGQNPHPQLSNQNSHPQLSNQQSHPQLSNQQSYPHLSNQQSHPHLSNQQSHPQLSNQQSHPQLSNQQSHPQLSNQQSHPQLSNQQSHPQLSNQQSHPQLSNQQSHPHLSNQQSHPQLSNQQSHPQLSNQQSHPQLSNQQSHPQLSNQQSHPQLTNQQSHPQLSNQQSHPQLSNQQAHPQLSNQQSHPQLSNQQSHPQLSNQQSHPQLSNQQSHPHLSNQPLSCQPWTYQPPHHPQLSNQPAPLQTSSPHSNMQMTGLQLQNSMRPPSLQNHPQLPGQQIQNPSQFFNPTSNNPPPGLQSPIHALQGQGHPSLPHQHSPPQRPSQQQCSTSISQPPPSHPAPTLYQQPHQQQFSPNLSQQTYAHHHLPPPCLDPQHPPPPPPPQQQQQQQQASPALASSDSRLKSYFHLCGLFPTELVQQVMAQFPRETDPQTLCKHLLTLKTTDP